jgi:hypothetical protein
MASDLVLAQTRVLNADEAHHLGSLLAASEFFKDSKDAAKAAVKVMAGAELGFGPVASMTGIHIVEGKVSLGAKLVAAAIERSERYSFRVDPQRFNEQECAIDFYKHGELVGTSVFTMADATKAGVAGKDNWRKYPRNMLFARAMTNGAQWYAAGVFGGPIYTPEELGADVDAEGEIIALPTDEAPPESAVKPPPPSAPAPTPSVPSGDAGEPSAAPQDAPMSEVAGHPPVASGVADGTPTGEIAGGSPAQIMAQLGISESTQRFLLVEAGVEDIENIDRAFAGLTEEQAEKVVAGARARAS